MNISNWNFKSSVSLMMTFNNCTELNNVIMNNSDYVSINKLIGQLPTRTADNPGTLDITGVDDIAQVNIANAQAKYWNIING